MAASDTNNRFMVDPSVLLSEAGVGWLEGDESCEEVAVISQAFIAQLRENPRRLFFPFLAEDRSQAYEWFGRRLLDVVDGRGLTLFSHETVELAPEYGRVHASILETNDPDAGIVADQWAYLQSQSFMVSTTGAFVRAARSAGAAVVSYADAWTRESARLLGIKEKDIPEKLTGKFVAKVGAKYVVVGGVGLGAGAGGVAAGTLIGLPTLGAATGPMGAIAARAALHVIDP